MRKVLLIILDGWGEGRNDYSNPIYLAKEKDFFEFIKDHFPFYLLQASGIAVGLPWKEEGNSEVGHLCMGIGKVYYQNYPRITLAIRDGSFFKNEVLIACLDHARKYNSRVHLVGLLTEGIIHSAYEHLIALLDFFKKNKIQKRKGYYEFMGFKSKIAHFETSIFFKKYGLDYIAVSSKEKLKNSTIIDCGAYIGDSAFIFEKELSPKEIICIEPDEKNFEILLENIKLNNLNEKIKPLKCAISDKEAKGEIHLSTSMGGYIIETEKGKVQISTIDNLIFNQFKSQNVGLIKMDIEGYELLAIKGAKETIKKFKPVLIISLYHKGQDFFEIPKYLKEIIPNYKFSFVNLNFENPTFERILIAEI